MKITFVAQVGYLLHLSIAGKLPALRFSFIIVCRRLMSPPVKIRVRKHPPKEGHVLYFQTQSFLDFTANGFWGVCQELGDAIRRIPQYKQEERIQFCGIRLRRFRIWGLFNFRKTPYLFKADFKTVDIF